MPLKTLSGPVHPSWRIAPSNFDDDLRPAAVTGQPKKTVVFVDHTAMLGGGEIALYHLASSLLDSIYHPIVVLGADGPLRAKLQEAGVETHVLPLNRNIATTKKDSLGPRSLLRIGAVAQSLAYIARLTRFLRQLRPDLVHTNSLKSDIFGGIAARLIGAPVIWHVRDRIADDYLPPAVAQTFRWLCHRIPSVIVANSQATLDTLHLSPHERSRVVYSGIGSAFASVVHDGAVEPSEDMNAETSVNAGPLIGLVGRISPWKGQDVFIRAAAQARRQIPNARLQIIGSCLFGEESYEQEARALVKQLDMEDCIEFLGFRSDVPSLIRNLDILVHTSTKGEPFGQVIVEGMAASKPVVATNGGGVPEIVVDGVTGILDPMGEAPPMAEAIIRLALDPNRAAAMGRAGLERVKGHFTIHHTVDKVMSVYEDILSATPRAAV